jgi:Sulfotransferase family
MTPRTACTAIGELLRKHFGGEFVPGEDILDSHGRVSVQKKHSTLSELIQHGLLTGTESEGLLKVAAVRNPFDSLVSVYLKKRLKYEPLLSDPSSWVNRSPGYADDMRYCQTHSFNAWIFRLCSKKITKRLLGNQPSMFADYTRGMDVVMRYESLEKDLGEVFKRAGMASKAEIPVINRTVERNNRHYRSFYSRPAALMVQCAYSYDLKTYGYRF